MVQAYCPSIQGVQAGYEEFMASLVHISRESQSGGKKEHKNTMNS